MNITLRIQWCLFEYNKEHTIKWFQAQILHTILAKIRNMFLFWLFTNSILRMLIFMLRYSSIYTFFSFSLSLYSWSYDLVCNLIFWWLCSSYHLFFFHEILSRLLSFWIISGYDFLFDFQYKVWFISSICFMPNVQKNEMK